MVSATARICSACVGSLATALIVTPLDVAKVQMQASQATRELRAGVSSVQHLGCKEFVCSNGISEHRFSKTDCEWRHIFREQAQTMKRRATTRPGVLGTMRAILAEEGPRGLYAGLPTTLTLAIPSNVLYFASYEALRDKLMDSRILSNSQVAAPTLAGGLSRTVAVCACAPIEIVRTRLQAQRLTSPGGRQSPLQVAGDLLRQEGPWAFFRGLHSTLWRDVPFSALYWIGVEAIRRSLARRGWWEGSAAREPLTSLVAGCFAGGAAALVTTPFDVVKTRREVENIVAREVPVRQELCLCGSDLALGSTASTLSRPSLLRPNSALGTLVQLAREEGLQVLMTGAVPRVAKVAPACAIMLGTYEATKVLLKG